MESRLNPMQLQWLQFYLHGGEDNRGRTLAQIRRQRFSWLEGTHDYIQWLFPLPEASRANQQSPLLTETLARRFLSHPNAKSELLTSVDCIAHFWGIQRRNLHFSANDVASEQEPLWCCSANHNHLRISRVLGCLSCLGLAPLAYELLGYLLNTLHQQGIEPNDLDCTGYWKNASTRPALMPEISPTVEEIELGLPR
ncbi:opioid growth factor receptor-related protein [Aestuariirhabdus sp. LZHN29]|uniref:opioid growth factor receptor-related protein n=1 Tax=Aestuariirhabdus sp. LZHN29 TaxID=3417462 RepID=UPI003CF157F4